MTNNEELKENKEMIAYMNKKHFSQLKKKKLKMKGKQIFRLDGQRSNRRWIYL